MLVSFKGNIHQQGLILPKVAGEKRLTQKEKDEIATDQSLRCAIQMLDNFTLETSLKGRFITLTNKLLDYVYKQRERIIAARQRWFRPRFGISDGFERGEQGERDGSDSATGNVHE